MNNVYCLMGGSGCGKTSIQKILQEKYDLIPIVSYTTRKPRYKGEDNHIFVSNDEFSKLKDMIAYTEFCGNKYCATAEQVENSDLYTIDPKGIEYFRNNYHGSKGIKVIYIKSPIHTRIERMERRWDKFSLIMERIVNDAIEFRGMEDKADFVIDNGDNADIKDVADKIYEWIKSVDSEA